MIGVLLSLEARLQSAPTKNRRRGFKPRKCKKAYCRWMRAYKARLPKNRRRGFQRTLSGRRGFKPRKCKKAYQKP